MHVIRKTSIGPSGLEVGGQGLGCMNLTGFYGRPFDEQEGIRTVQTALDLGVTLLDTADTYGQSTDTGFGGNEAFVGKAIRGRRDEVVLATKFGLVNRAEATDGQSIRGDRAYVRSACDASLGRLGVEHIDLYFCHRLDPRVPVEETIGAMAELITAGKVRYLGVSAVSAQSLAAAAAVHPITALESEWSLFTRDIEVEVVPLARKLGVAIVPYAPLGRGFLTGQVRSFDDLAPDDFRRTAPRFQPGNFERNLDLVEHIKKLADDKHSSTAQIALAWLHAQGPDVVPIPGADRPGFVADNAAALDVPLTADDLAGIEAVFPFGAAAGARYGDMRQVSDAIVR
jgi:aryl-alcohol dehydrogenase-like predicted oxidoreductase